MRHVTFNHGVEGSSPSALTKKPHSRRHFLNSPRCRLGCAQLEMPVRLHLDCTVSDTGSSAMKSPALSYAALPLPFIPLQRLGQLQRLRTRQRMRSAGQRRISRRTLNPVKLLRPRGDDETVGQTDEAIFMVRRRYPETNKCSNQAKA